MGFSPGGSKGVRSEINVTPLVDVVLVLLIIFMVVAPMLQRAKGVELPKAAHAEQGDPDEEPLVLAVTRDKRVWIGNRALAQGALESNVKRELKKDPRRRVLLKGDEQLTVRDVREVMHKVRQAGAKGVALSVQDPDEEGNR